MADLAKYQQEISKFNTKYAREAVKEPVNFWGLAGFAVAAAYTQSVIPLLIALIFELIYIFVVPMLPNYRQLVNTREKERVRSLNKATRDKLIESFTPREREASEIQLQDKLLEYKQQMGLLGSGSNSSGKQISAASEVDDSETLNRNLLNESKES